ncbi:UDP-4-amino-4,6-dideoxy-N-acetyl-beta-L-altrosamine N-acetyltransferase [uncultured Marinobacter sp.]|uniref:UDP-4-amino-4, 6-dideoxy-N-acetyl-beta-L-altrosamine N-acetyltransferase n=1 Tax=uncultured Marinobacter sp. TaxID=187379 RepID=UPI00258A2F74|nr:UDP-4-amino-4,6-dideoxy-N-acetyl-beta-L-altrosamine N-acetyltransferase [uncultured Marinobacter sp.]
MTELPAQFGALRPIHEAELELMLSWRNEPTVRENMYTTHEITLEEHRAWWAKVQASDTQRYFMYEQNGQPLGVVGFTGIDQSNVNSFWAFYASPSAPRGTGSRMELLALNHAFDELKLHKLCCEVLAFNTPVIKLHEKFGFKVEGILRDQYKRGDQYVDIYRLGMMAEEWADQRPKMQEKLIRMVGG